MPLLSAEQMNGLHRKETLSLPEGRYLLPFEIMGLFHLQKKSITADQETAMQDCWRMWMESHDNDNRDTGLTTQEKIHNWDRFVVANYAEPLPDLSAAGESPWRA